ncbi:MULTISPECIES: YjfB family protein [Hydrogenophilus]|uniref:Motility protein n=1 Tax=Hydrogenophilus thermoluteolus TaxID=297 RepID=A0A2Z6DW52_HYDTE|nr:MULTISPECIES: YjfB family protein [Hydrogenophilus]BBD76579.1 hypothetical protein HPTL_0311 [Hydrogenophilus thermoluteolus]
MDTMDVTQIANVLQQNQVTTAIQTAVLKKINDVQEQTALSLLAALPQPSNPPHLGNTVDVKA